MKIRTLWVLASLSVLASCGKQSNNGANNLPPIDAGDLSVPDTGKAGSDVGRDVGSDIGSGDLGPDAGTPGALVALDLEPYLGDAGGQQVSRVYELEGDAPFSGPVIQGRPGDWVIENDRARFLIEGDKRVMSPCPWGGTIIDAASLDEGRDEDILGEICMMFNGSVTMRPDRFDVIADGSDGRAAVLAASGRFAVGDFLNIPAMIGDYIDGLAERITLDINAIPPVRLTLYYVLRPGENSVHVITAMRNDSDAQVDLLPVYLVASGGDGQYFNPQASTGGFGVGGSDIGVGIDDLPFLAFVGDTASYAFAPKPDPRVPPKTLPLAGSYIVISGVAAALLGTQATKVLNVLSSTPEQLAASEDVTHIAPGAVEVMEHRVFVGSGDVSTLVDPIYDTMEVATATLQGVVHDTNGQPVAGALVTAKRRGFKTMNQALSGPDGRFQMNVPPESYEIIARKGGMAPAAPVELEVAADEVRTVEGVTVKLPATIRVRVTTPDDGCAATTDPAPVAARLTVVCEGPCPDAPAKTELDTGKNSLPEAFATIVYSEPDGVLETELPPGPYRLVVDRGMEWSTWPSDAVAAGGYAINPQPGELIELDAEIARVLDTPNAYSGDFHVHTISSPDSPVPWVERVKHFLSEGLDVMVSTDHDSIADYGPAIASISAGPFIQSITGEEVTTADLGHFNAFPMPYQAALPRGGALDWGNGEDFSYPPAELYAELRALSNLENPVIQMNHAEGLGLVKFAQADVLRGITYADRDKHRLPPQEPDPATGDTGIWSDDFTAMELLNGNSRNRFYTLGRWWMTMIGRGFTPTGTAVTDTHKLYSDLGAVPRTYVFGQNDYSCGIRSFDGLTDYDGFVAQYAADVNAGRAIGTNGPFFTVTVTNGAGDTAALGDTIALDAQTTATLEIQMPEWVRVTALDVYLNPDPADVVTRPGEIVSTEIPPTTRIPITWDDATQLVTVTTGTFEHKVRRKTMTVPLQADGDAFVIFVVHGGDSMWPIVGSGPFAFSNPVYLDADGNGYDNPPYAALASEPPDLENLPPCRDAFCGTRAPADPNTLTPQEIIEVIKHLDCQNPLHRH